MNFEARLAEARREANRQRRLLNRAITAAWVAASIGIAGGRDMNEETQAVTPCATDPPARRDACADRLRRNGIDPNNVVQVDLLPCRLALIHEVDADDEGKYSVRDSDGVLRLASKRRPRLRLLLR